MKYASYTKEAAVNVNDLFDKVADNNNQLPVAFYDYSDDYENGYTEMTQTVVTENNDSMADIDMAFGKNNYNFNPLIS